MFRVIHGERAEVLSFTTHADSGKMPGVLPSMGVGELVLGPINLITAIKDAALSGQTIYSSQIEYLAGKTADQVADYLSQYSADEGWIPRNQAKSVKFADDCMRRIDALNKTFKVQGCDRCICLGNPGHASCLFD